MEKIERKIARLVDRRFEILNVLYPNSEFNISKLAEITGLDHSNISRYIDELEREKLVTTRGKKRDMGKPYRYCRLTAKCKEILSTIIDAARPEPKELRKPDPEYLMFIFEVLENPCDKEMLKHALEDFRHLCQATQIWEHKKPKQQKKSKKTKRQKKHKKQEYQSIWSFFDKAIGEKNYLPEMMFNLRSIATNARRVKKRSVIDRVAKFSDTIKNLATSPETDMNTRHEAVRTLDVILPNKKKWETFTDLLEKVIEEKDVTYKEFIRHLYPPFEELHRKHGIELRRWFYNLMRSEDSIVESREGGIAEVDDEKKRKAEEKRKQKLIVKSRAYDFFRVIYYHCSEGT